MLVELSSDTLPAIVVRRMSKQADRLVEKGLKAVLEMVLASMDINLLLYAFEEVKRITQMVKDDGEVIKVNEKNGTIRGIIRHGEYYFQLVMKVDGNYPDSQVEVSAGVSNFNDALVLMHVCQAQELARRCSMGYTVEQALAASNPIKQPNKNGGKKAPRMTSGYLNHLKGDVKFLKQATDLRQVNGKKCSGRTGFANDTATRRAARRELKSISKQEMEKEAQHVAMEQSIEALEQASLSATGEHGCQSIMAIFNFMKNNFVTRMVAETCQICNELVLPKDPVQANRIISQKALNRPERVLCGHWYHWQCLDKWMRNPPFGKTCPSCDRILFHPDWDADVKKLERDWANKQNKDRELGEVADCFDLNDDFRI